MKKNALVLVAAIALLSACGNNNETSASDSKENKFKQEKNGINDSSNADLDNEDELEEVSRGLEDIFSKDITELEESDWEDVYITKEDYNNFINNFASTALESDDPRIQSSELIDHENIEFIFHDSMTNELDKTFTVYFLDLMIRSMYINSGYYQEKSPSITYLNSDGSLYAELDDFDALDLGGYATIEELETANLQSGGLINVGDTTDGIDGSTVTLKNIIHVNDVLDYGPLSLEIKDLKILEISNPSYSELSEANNYSKHEISDTFNYLQVTYIATNQSDNLITWIGFDKVVFNNGQQIDVSTNSYANGRDWDSDFYGGVFKEEFFGAIIDGSPNDIEWVKLVTSNVYDGDYNKIMDGKEHDFNF